MQELSIFGKAIDGVQCTSSWSSLSVLFPSSTRVKFVFFHVVCGCLRNSSMAAPRTCVLLAFILLLCMTLPGEGLSGERENAKGTRKHFGPWIPLPRPLPGALPPLADLPPLPAFIPPFPDSTSSSTSTTSEP